MKKMFSILLILCLACLAASAAAEDYSGMWYFVRGSGSGVIVAASDSGTSMTLNLKEDGTAELTGDGITEAYAWVSTGDVVLLRSEQATLMLTADSGELVMSSDDVTMYFSRKAPETPAPSAEYAGTWRVVRLSSQDTTVPVTDEDTLLLTIALEADGSALIDTVIDGEPVNFSGSWAAGNGLLSISYADGSRLTFRITDDELVYSEDTLTMFLSRTPLSPVPSAEYAGEWNLVRIHRQGVIMRFSESREDVQFTLRLEPEGASEITMVAGGEPTVIPGVWGAVKGFVIMNDSNGQEYYFEVRDDEIAMTSANGTMILSRTAPAFDGTIAPAVAAESTEPFSGSWSLSNVFANDVEYELSIAQSIEAFKEIRFEDGNLVFSANGIDLGSISASFNSGEGVMDAMSDEDGSSVSLRFTLREDGSLTASVFMDTTEVLLRFVRAE